MEDGIKYKDVKNRSVKNYILAIISTLAIGLYLNFGVGFSMGLALIGLSIFIAGFFVGETFNLMEIGYTDWLKDKKYNNPVWSDENDR